MEAVSDRPRLDLSDGRLNCLVYGAAERIGSALSGSISHIGGLRYSAPFTLIRTIHLNPKAEFYPRVLLPGDPARALAIAQDQLNQPRMFNHRRGLWGYSGIAADGNGLLIQATGMGGPSTAIICEELAELGAEVMIRVGTCGAIANGLKLGDLIVVTDAHAFDGTSRAIGGKQSYAANPGLIERLEHAAGHDDGPFASRLAPIASSDVFYERSPGRLDQFAAVGAQAVEMEAATVLAVAAHHEIKAACLLGVTDILKEDSRERLDQETVEELGRTLGRVAAKALTI